MLVVTTYHSIISLSVVKLFVFHRKLYRKLREKSFCSANMRQIYAIKLLQGINFLEINLSQLEDVLSKTVASIFRCDPNLYQMVFNESRRQGGTSETTEVAAPPPDLLNSRGMEMALLKIGGFGGCGVTNEITYRLSSSQTWRHLTSVPHVEQCNFGSAVFENELYVIGGCFNQALQENVHPFGFRLVIFVLHYTVSSTVRGIDAYCRI